jgi:hypothetical protein
MDTKLNIPGLGEVERKDWYITFDMGETVLLANVKDLSTPKVWITRDEWEGNPPTEAEKEEEPPTEIPKFKPLKDAVAAFDEEKQTVVKDVEASHILPPDSLYTLTDLEELTLNELVVALIMGYGEAAVRKKLYAVDGHCPKDKKCSVSCKERADVDS